MRLAVTGSSGQIGSFVVDLARNRGYDCVGIDVRPSGWTSVVADIRNPDSMREALAGVGAIVHCAAEVSVQGSLDHPHLDASTNVLGTVNLLKVAVDRRVNRFVNVSSAAVYGHPVATPIAEAHPTMPLSPYGVSKLAAEHYVRVFSATHPISTVTVRPFNVYSVRQRPDNPYTGVMHKFLERISLGQPPIVHGSGRQTRDFIHAEDVARALLDLAGGTVSGTFNLGTGVATSINHLAHLFLTAAALDCVPAHAESRPADIHDSVADVHAMSKVVGRATTSLADGVRELVAAGSRSQNAAQCTPG